MVGDYPFSFIHGDLNGANVIIDERDNVWLIDFFHTHRGHIFKDFAKLENDLLYIYTPIKSENDLTQAYAFTDFLLGVEHPFLGLTFSSNGWCLRSGMPSTPLALMNQMTDSEYGPYIPLRRLATF